MGGLVGGFGGRGCHERKDGMRERDPEDTAASGARGGGEAATTTATAAGTREGKDVARVRAAAHDGIEEEDKDGDGERKEDGGDESAQTTVPRVEA